MQSYKFTLYLFLFLNILAAKAQITCVVQDSKTYINDLCDNDAMRAENLKKEQMKKNIPELFSKNNLSKDMNSINATNCIESVLLTPKANMNWEIGDSIYRLPTSEELTFYVPSYKNEKDKYPMFNKSGKIYNNQETLKIGSNVSQTYYSDYSFKGKNVIYALRFKNTLEKNSSENPDRYAFRYEYTHDKLVVMYKFIGKNSSIKKVTDIDEEDWWKREHYKTTVIFPLDNGFACYSTSDGKMIKISSETVSMEENIKNSKCYVRPILDIESTYEKNMTFFYYNIYGENINIDKARNPQNIVHIGCMPPKICIYAKGSPKSPKLENEELLHEYGTINKIYENDKTVEYHFLPYRNLGATERKISFQLKNGRQEKEVKITLPALEIKNNLDSLPCDYMAKSYAADDSGWSSKKEDCGSFDYDSAIERAKFQDEDVLYHLPTMYNMNCMFPTQDKRFDKNYCFEEQDIIQYGENDSLPAKSSYFCSGNGVIYAIRFIDTYFACAYQYSFNKDNSLKVCVVPLGNLGFKIKDAREIKDGSIFQRNSCKSWDFYLTDNSGSGYLWSCDEVTKESAYGIKFNKNGIFHIIENKGVVMGIVPFIGASEVQNNTETDSDNQLDLPKRHRNKRQIVHRQPSNNNSSNNKNSHQLLIIDKTK